MNASRRPAALPLLLIGLVVLCLSVALTVALTVQAQSQEVTPTADATGTNPPAKPTNLQASAEQDSVTLAWTASTDQTVTHYAILRRNRDTDATGVFHVIESNAGPETSYDDGSVSASSKYNYRVKAISPTGVSQWSGYVKADTPVAPEPTPVPTPTSAPTPEPESTPVDLAPSNLTAALAEGGGVNLSWTDPAEDANSVTGYEVLRAVGEGELATLVADTASTATAYTDTTATEAGETYAYQVKAIRGEDRSQASGQAQVQVPHDPVDLAPSNLTAALAEGGGVALSWAAPAKDADSVTGYEILRAAGEGEMATLAADTGSTATAYTDATATEAGETYTYKVKAVRGEDRSRASGQAEVQIPHDPVDLAPLNLTAALAEGGGVTLTWTAPAEDADSVTGYEILRAVGEGEMATLAADTASTATSYTDATATKAGETYSYQVKAIRGEDRSQASGQAQVQLPHDPADLRPTGLTVSLVENKVTLSWTAPQEDAETVDGYEILRRRPYEGEDSLATLVANTESTATTYTDATANEAGVVYVYRIKALRGDDVSLWSNFDIIELASDYVLNPTPEPESTPDDQAPTGLTAVLAQGGGVSLTWTAPAEAADSITGYEILRAVGEGEMSTLAADTASTGTSYTDATATEAGETYAYQVKAIRGEDRSDASEQAQVQLPHDPVDLVPTGLIAVVLTASVVGEEEDSTQVGLTWSAPAEDADSVTGYEILRAVGDGESATLKADTGSTFTFYTDATATQSGTSYAYRVKAIRGDDRSQASGLAQVQLPHDAVDLAPSDLAAEAVDGGVDLSWSAPAEDAGTVTGYEIMRAVGEGAMATLAADTASTATTYTDATATVEGETYAYQVKAIRDGVRSQASAQASVVRPAAIIVGMCEFVAGGSDLPADTSTACALAVGGSVRGETGAAGDVDWYRVGLQADATYQFDMRGKSTGEWQLVDGVPAFVSAGTLEDPKLLGVYDSSGALVPGSNSEVAGTGKDSRIASFSPDAAGVYYISASAESGWTGTYELSVTVTADENAEELASLAPSGLEVSMVRNRLTLSWTAPAADAESVTGYEILRGEGEVEPTTLVADTASTSTSYRDETATQAGVSYTYAVKALRGDEASVESNRASYTLPSGYTAASKELASKVYVHSQVVGETLEFAPQVVVSPDQEPFTIWSGQLNLGLNRAFTPPTNGSLVPNTFTYNGVDYTISALGIIEQYNSDIYDYEYDLFFEISPPIGAENTAAWKFVSAPDDAEFAFADATVRYYDNGQEEYFKWPNSGLSAWYPRAGTPFPVSVTGLPGTDGQEPEVDTTPGIKLSWKTRTILAFGDFQSIPTKVGFTIHRSQRNEWGNFGSGQQQVGEVLKCDIAESGGAQSCLTIGTVGSRVSESWTWTDETAQRGVSYLYTIKPYHEFYSTNRSSVWHGNIIPIVDSLLAAPADRVRIYGQASNVSHRMPHPEAPGTPANLTASQPDSGTCTGSCVRLTWDAAPNAAKYVVFRVGQRTRETWVDNGLTYPQQRFHPADPDLTVPEWEDTSAEPGVNYGYRVAAFNDDGLRSATDAVVGIETLGGTTVPNRVRSLTAEATLKDRVTNTGQTVAGDQSLNTTTRERFAQRFKTGGTSGKIRLRWIAVKFGEIQNVSTAPDVLEATVNTVSGSVPGTTMVCTLTDPAAYVSDGVNTYYASSCDLDANTAYFFVLKRTGGTTTIELDYTTSLAQDPGSTAGWGIADSRYQYDSSGSGTWSSANQVHLIEVIHAPLEAEVTLNWTAPVGQSSVTGYEVQYRLDIPEKAEWDDDWKTLRTEAANAVSSTHKIALEKYYSRRNFYPTGAPTFTGTVAFGQTLTAETSGISDPDSLTNPNFSYQWFLNRALISGETGSTFGPLTDIQAGGNISLRVSFTDDKGKRESLVSGASPRVDPVEYVPTADKGTLRLNDTENDTDTTNDLILPFGITYEYRVRAVNGTNKGLPADKEGVRIPNQDGLQSVVIIEFVHKGGCLMWKHSADPEGNEPDGYRLLFASDTRRFHQAKVVVDYVSYVGAPPSPQAVGHCVAPGHLREDWQGYQPQRQASPSTDLSYWIAVQAYDADGIIAKGDGTGGRRSHGSAEIMKWVNKESNENVPPAKGSEAESVGSGEGSQ